MRTKYIAVMLLFQLLFGCSHTKPERKDFIGTWKADDGATVQLKEDGSLIVNQINLSNIFFDNKNPANKIDFTGKWEFTKDNYKRQVIKVNSSKYTFNFNTSGQGALENKPPWDLYVWIGDPDDMNKYKFVKQ